MGHVVNPTSLRLGYNLSPTYAWHSRLLFLYSSIFDKTSFIRSYLWRMFTAHHFRELILISDIRVYTSPFGFNVHLLAFSTLLSAFLQDYTLLDVRLPFRGRMPSIRKKLRFRVFKNLVRFFVHYAFLFPVFTRLGLIISKDLFFCFGVKSRISFIAVPQEALTASAWTDFICQKLKNKNTFGHTMTQVVPIFNQMLYQVKLLSGYKITCNGRLSRRGRAAAYIKSRGKLPFSRTSAYVSYSCRSVVLKNSICGIKVWLFYRRNPVARRRFITSRCIMFSAPLQFSIKRREHRRHSTLNLPATGVGKHTNNWNKGHKGRQ